MASPNRTWFSVRSARVVDKDTGIVHNESIALYPVGFVANPTAVTIGPDNEIIGIEGVKISQDDFAFSFDQPILAGTVTLPTNEAERWFPPPTDMKYDLILTGDGEPKAKAVIESMADMQRLANGEPVDVNWYRKAGEEWEFVERRPLKFNFKSPETPE